SGRHPKVPRLAAAPVVRVHPAREHRIGRVIGEVTRRAGGSVARPRLAVTLGDVRGIGPEIVAKALANATARASADFLVVGPERAGVDVDVSIGEWSSATRGDAATAGRLAGLAIERAVALAREGSVQGIVTAPIDKAALLAGGY